MTSLGSETLPLVSRLVPSPHLNEECRARGKSGPHSIPQWAQIDTSVLVLIEQTLYLPIHLHLEKKCPICCLAMALFQCFKSSAKKKKKKSGWDKLPNKLPTSHFHVSPNRVLQWTWQRWRWHNTLFYLLKIIIFVRLWVPKITEMSEFILIFFFLSQQKNKIYPRKLLHFKNYFLPLLCVTSPFVFPAGEAPFAGIPL